MHEIMHKLDVQHPLDRSVENGVPACAFTFVFGWCRMEIQFGNLGIFYRYCKLIV
jgi:hypothetical protein